MNSQLQSNRRIRDLSEQLLVGCKLAISEKDRSWVEHFVDRNELEIAFDEMLQVLSSDRTVVTSQQFELINALGAELDLDSRQWEELRPS